MKIKLLPVLLAATIMVFTQCKKDSGGDNTPSVTKDYSPLTTGSTFTFKDVSTTNGITSTSNYTLTVTNTDTVVNSKSYRKLTGSDTSVRFRAKIGANYYQLASLSGLGVAGFEDNYLNDSVGGNSSWTETTSPFAIPGSTFMATATLTYKLAAKGGSLVVSGTTYTDVINVQLSSLSVASSGISFPIMVTTGSYYYAKGFGLIQGDLVIPAQTVGIPPLLSIPVPAYSLSQTLITATIK